MPIKKTANYNKLIYTQYFFVLQAKIYKAFKISIPATFMSSAILLLPILHSPFSIKSSTSPFMVSPRSKFKSRGSRCDASEHQQLSRSSQYREFPVSERTSGPSTLCKHYTDALWNLSKQCTHQSNAPTSPFPPPLPPPRRESICWCIYGARWLLLFTFYAKSLDNTYTYSINARAMNLYILLFIKKYSYK